MKVLIDTCIVMDFLQNRVPFAEEARSLFLMTSRKLFSGFITAKSATDIYYLLHRYTHSTKESRLKLSRLLDIVEILDTISDDIVYAISSDVSDFEDAVMIATAIRAHVDCIVTRNTKDYSKSPAQIYTPAQFLDLLEKVKLSQRDLSR